MYFENSNTVLRFFEIVKPNHFMCRGRLKEQYELWAGEDQDEFLNEAESGARID